MRLYKCGGAAAATAAMFMDVKGYYLLMLLPFTAIIQQTGNCFYFGVWSRQTDTNPELSQLQWVSLGGLLRTLVALVLLCRPFCFGGGSWALKWLPLDATASAANVCECIGSRKA